MFDPSPTPHRPKSRRGKPRSEEGTAKNPIYSRLSPGTSAPWRDAVVEQVRGGRDRFHDLAHKHLGRNYSRPPIYLVDDWVVDVLGAFYVAGGPRGTTTPPNGPGHGPSATDVRRGSTQPDPWLRAVMNLFSAVQSLRASWLRAWLLDLNDLSADLVEAASALTVATIEDKGVDQAGAMVQHFLTVGRQVTQTAWQALSDAPEVKRWLRRDVRAQLEADLQRASEAAHALVHLRPQAFVEQVGMAPGRPGGLLPNGFASLDIEGPAVVIAPHRIEAWSHSFGGVTGGFHGGHDPRHTANEERHGGLWQGPATLSTAFRVALTSVVAHELTHVMLRLPRDKMRKPHALRDAANRLGVLYAANPEIEEGAANFIGGLASLGEIGEFGEESGVPLRGRPSWRELWAAYQGLIEATIGGYHTEASLAYFKAWSGTGHSLRAFAGLFNVLALDQEATSWEGTMAELARGRITLAR